MTIRRKLTSTCAILVASSAVLALVSYCAIRSTNRQLQSLATDAFPGLQTASEIDALVLEYRGNCWKHIASSDAQTMAAIESSNAAVRDKLSQGLHAYEMTIHLAEDREQFARVQPAVDRYFQAWEQVLPLSRAGKNEAAAAKYMEVAHPAYQQLRHELDTVVKWNVDYGARTASNGEQAAQSGQTVIGLLGLAIMLLGAGLATFLVRGLVTSLREITGNLTQNAKQVAGAASQVASSSQQLAQNATEQAASLEETSASTQEITTHIQKNVETAAQLTTTMASAVPIVQRVKESLDSMVESMSGLNSSSQKIASIVKVIDEIAFQTNILALNAAVEAARSGEAGMGFAVVADEVRNLAHRSAQAAKETGGLIEESVRMVQQTAGKLELLIGASRENAVHAGRVKELVDDVAAATQQQANAIQEIARAIPQLEQATHHIAANAEESASAAEEMTAQSSALTDVARDLTAMMGV